MSATDPLEQQIDAFAQQIETGRLTWVKPAAKRPDAQKAVDLYRAAEKLQCLPEPILENSHFVQDSM